MLEIVAIFCVIGCFLHPALCGRVAKNRVIIKFNKHSQNLQDVTRLRSVVRINALAVFLVTFVENISFIRFVGLSDKMLINLAITVSKSSLFSVEAN